jgi:hypothetical protein
MTPRMEKRRASSVQLPRSLPAQAGRAYEEAYGCKLDRGILRDARLWRPLSMREEYAAASTQVDQPSLIPRRPQSGPLEGRGPRPGVAETSFADSPDCSRAERPRRGQINNVGIRECRQYPGLMRTRASANTSGPDSTWARRPPVKLRSPLRRTAPNEENLFLLPDRA